jgi:hypothetical protein
MSDIVGSSWFAADADRPDVTREGGWAERLPPAQRARRGAARAGRAATQVE